MAVVTKPQTQMFSDDGTIPNNPRLPFVLYRNTGTTSGGYSPTEEKRWRGQPIDYSPRHDVTPNNSDPLAAIKRWFRKR